MPFCQKLLGPYWNISTYLAQARKSNKAHQKIPKCAFCNGHHYNNELVYLDCVICIDFHWCSLLQRRSSAAVYNCHQL
jgi:hypothetical protein